MFKTRLKFGCSVIYSSMQLKKTVFSIQNSATSELQKKLKKIEKK